MKTSIEMNILTEFTRLSVLDLNVLNASIISS